MSAPRIPTHERFWTKVDRTGECWIWIGRRDLKGYGRISISGSRKTRPAHRLAFEWAYGPIPDHLQVDHLCHNPSCVRPDHLRAVTNKTNGENRRGANRNSVSGVRGVDFDPRTGSWRARVTHHGITRSAGSFPDLEQAEAAAVSLRAELFGSAR